MFHFGINIKIYFFSQKSFNRTKGQKCKITTGQKDRPTNISNYFFSQKFSTGQTDKDPKGHTDKRTNKH